MEKLAIGSVIDNGRLTEIFGCSPQGGMRRSLANNTLVIVCNHFKSIYDDQWIDGVMHYTGMGQEGDQSIDAAQNKTLANSDTNGIEVHLFEVYEDKRYTYSGQVKLHDQPYFSTQPDANGNDRQVVVFPLISVSGSEPSVRREQLQKLSESKERIAKRLSDDEIRKRALLRKVSTGSRVVTSKQYDRDPWVSEYAKRRANGHCQLCEQPAPFLNGSKQPYLETHHLIWMSKGGADTPENTVALCPNCHRKMHIVDDPKDLESLALKLKDTDHLSH